VRAHGRGSHPPRRCFVCLNESCSSTPSVVGGLAEAATGPPGPASAQSGFRPSLTPEREHRDTRSGGCGFELAMLNPGNNPARLERQFYLRTRGNIGLRSIRGGEFSERDGCPIVARRSSWLYNGATSKPRRVAFLAISAVVWRGVTAQASLVPRLRPLSPFGRDGFLCGPRPSLDRPQRPPRHRP